ncbi:MAG: hypothetical protein MUC77_19635 [Chromatiaceae bacterium]|nr:hypothetical protein [Chromatiaceae bacterium]
MQSCSAPGLTQAFPGGVDVETYARSKPHFESAAEGSLVAANDITGIFRLLVRNFGEGI